MSRWASAPRSSCREARKVRCETNFVFEVRFDLDFERFDELQDGLAEVFRGRNLLECTEQATATKSLHNRNLVVRAVGCW